MRAIGRKLDPHDQALVRVAQDALRRGYRARRHTVASAVRVRNGRVYIGLNVDGIHGPCAEPVALGAAMTAGEREVVAMVAVCRRGSRFPVLSPCGTCRQLLLDYAPRARVIVSTSGGLVRSLAVSESLPAAFRTFG